MTSLIAIVSHLFFKLKSIAKKRIDEIKQNFIEEAQKFAIVSRQSVTKEEAKDDYFDFDSGDETDKKVEMAMLVDETKLQFKLYQTLR